MNESTLTARSWLFLIFFGAFLAKIESKTASSYFENVCQPPVSLGVNDITSTSAVLTWSVTNSPADTAWDVEIVPVGTIFLGQPTTGFAQVPSFPVLISGLESGREYKFQVRSHAVCGTSGWSNSKYFRTRLDNPSRCRMALELKDSTCAPFSNHFLIEVNSAPGLELGTDVFVRSFRLILQHTWASDATIRLVSPSGKSVLLASAVGGGDDHFGDPTDVFCQKSCEFSNFCPISAINGPQADAPFIGVWSPMGDFSVFNDGSAPVGIWRLEVCDSRPNDLGILRFTEIQFARPDCLPPTDVAANVVSPTAAELTWTNAGLCQDSIFIEYGPSGFTPGTAKAAGGGTSFLKMISCSTAQPFLLMGLAPLTSYDVYFRKKCDVSSPFSFNSCKKTIFTDCLAPTLIEDFNGQNDCGTSCSSTNVCTISGLWQNVGGDDFDFLAHAGKTPSGSTGPDDDVSGGGKYVYIEPTCAGQNPLGKKGFLQSKCVLVDANGNCSMSFYYHMYGAVVDFLRLEVSTNSGLTWQNIWQKSGNQGNQWRQQFVDLTAFDGQIAVFRFIAQSGGPASTSDIALDEIRFFGSTDAGAPDYFFYTDSDGDGFGANSAAFSSCSPTVPTGFSSNNLDCDDARFSTNPDAIEILCNGLDDDCDGISDDGDIPAPTAFSVEKCKGERFKIWATSFEKGQHFWFSASSGGQFLSAGDSLDLGFLNASTTVFLVDSIVAGGCSSARTAVTATVRRVPDLSVFQNPSICKGEFFDLSTLAISDAVNTTGGITFHSSSPPTAANQLSVLNVSPSLSTSYVVKKATIFGCSDEATTFLTVKNPPTAIISQGNLLALCRGEQDFLNAAATGFPPFSFSWTGGNLGSTIWNYFTLPIVGTASGGTSQTYFLKATDGKGCFDTAQIQVTTAASISAVKIDSVFNVTACGGSNGRIELTPLNGTAPFSFFWKGPQNGSLLNQTGGKKVISGLKQGSYQISVADANGCSMTLPAQVIAAPGLAVALDSIFNVSCANGVDGKIELSVSGPSPIFQWSVAGQNFEDLKNIGAGQYSVTITSGNCVIELKNLVLTEPPPIQLFANQIDSISCFGAKNGGIDLGETGGTGGFSFVWSNGKTTEDISALGPGSFRTTVTDANGCAKISNWISLAEPAALVVSIDSLHPISCSYTTDGAIFLKRTGGNTGAMAFSWASGQAQGFLTNLPAGVFSVTATDAKGCSAQNTFNLAPPSPLGYQNLVVDHPTCIGKADGQLWLAATGGTAPHQYFWSNGASNSQLSGLEAGQLFLTITDSKNCLWSGPTTELLAPQLIDFQVVSSDSVDCFGQNTGAVEVQITGPNAPFSTVWNGSFLTQNFTNAAAGGYVAEVSDALGCRLKSDTVWVNGPANELLATVVSIENATCFSLTDGSIDLEIEGGTEPFFVFWNGQKGFEDLTEVGAGQYSATIHDARGCLFSTQNLMVGQPNEILENAVVSQPPCLTGTGFGSIELAPSGGAGAISTAWSNTTSTASIYNLSPGFYAATLTDATGCTKELKPIEIFDPTEAIRAQLIDYQSVSCHGANDGRVVLKLEGGQPPFQLLWSNGIQETISTSQKVLENLGTGLINVAVVDANFCTAYSDSAVIEEPSKLSGFYEEYRSPVCLDEATGFIEPTVSGGVPPYYFVWQMNGGSQSNKILLDSLSGGTYGLTVIDNNFCSVILPNIVLTQPASLLQIQLDSYADDRCASGNGFLEVSASGGGGQYFFEWNTGEIGPIITDLLAGFYQVSATDALGCLKQSEFEIKVGDDSILVAASTFPVACKGDSTGNVKLLASGGVAPYSFLWSNGLVSDSIFGLAGGIFHCSVADASGCESVVAVVVPEPAAAFLLDSVATSPASAAGFFDGSACIFMSGGSQPFSFAWPSSATTENCAGNLQNDIFQVTATDGYGCSVVVGMIEILVSATFLDALFELKLLPNPVSDFAFFESKSFENESFSIQIDDVLGKTMFRKSLFLNEKIDVRGWPSGTYFLKIWDEKGRSEVRKMVVEH